jgi:NitT/TauT family transport system substrate-binding protein
LEKAGQSGGMIANAAAHPSRRTLIAGAAAAAAAAPVCAQGLPTYQAGGVPEESIVTALWAEQSGFFRRNGFDLQIQSQRSGSAVAAAVAGGAFAIGKSSLVALIAAHVHDVPFVIVAPGGLYDSAHPNNALLVRSDSPIRSAADLNGKTIGVSSLNDLYTVATKAWVDDHGGDSTTLKLVELPIDAVGAALANSRIDATSIGTPQLEEYLSSGSTRILGRSYDAIAPQFMFSAWFTTRSFVEKNKAVVTGFQRAMRESATYVNGHRQQTIEVISKFTGIDPGVIAKMPRAVMGTTLDPKLVQPIIDRCARYKVIPASFPAAEFLA